MAARPTIYRPNVRRLRLDPFFSQAAEQVASWVRTEQDAFWLAPSSAPPITPATIRGWQSPGRQPLLLTDGEAGVIVGYGEMNVLNTAERSYWLGHLIIDPAQRSRGLGKQLTRLLLLNAFHRHAARKVTLIVFPENRHAVAAYRAAGLFDECYEEHDFPAYRLRKELLRMTATGVR
ncbi:Mycothiol acetyltransferase [Phycisphaerae bacterium RAS1]|nr:Mycothiol acetyltransferase [Phycisphaerae bacterium RAS1]